MLVDEGTMSIAQISWFGIFRCFKSNGSYSLFFNSITKNSFIPMLTGASLKDIA